LSAITQPRMFGREVVRCECGRGEAGTAERRGSETKLVNLNLHAWPFLRAGEPTDAERFSGKPLVLQVTHPLPTHYIAHFDAADLIRAKSNAMTHQDLGKKKGASV
jgi:hypothetical protein